MITAYYYGVKRCLFPFCYIHDYSNLARDLSYVEQDVMNLLTCLSKYDIISGKQFGVDGQGAFTWLPQSYQPTAKGHSVSLGVGQSV